MNIMREYFESKTIRYLLAGGWNTLFGYSCGVILFYSIGEHIHVIAIGVISNILAISMAFITYKLFVFRTKGGWVIEYMRSYLVYGMTAILGIGMLWILVDGFGIAFWISQGVAILLTVIISYVSHSKFTFRTSE